MIGGCFVDVSVAVVAWVLVVVCLISLLVSGEVAARSSFYSRWFL